MKKCIGKGLWGLVEERKRREGKEMRQVFEDGWSRGKRKDGIRNRSGKRRRSALRGHRCVPSLALFLLSSAVCARHSSPPFSGESALGGKVRALAKAEDQKGNPIKLGLHLSSVHLTSSVIVQPKPPGADRNSPTHVNTNARLRSHQNNRH